MFTEHLPNVFTPFLSNFYTPEKEINEFLESPHQLSPPVEKLKLNEINEAFNKEVSFSEAPGYHLISGKILKELPDITIK